MTDATVPELPTNEGGKQTFQIVPTLDGYLELTERVDHLEANQPATGGNSGVSEDELSSIHDRLDRHRNEIEEIKRRYNSLIRYLDSVFNGTTPTAAPQPTSVGSQDTIQPQQRKDLIQ